MNLLAVATSSFWPAVTRLGEALILLPAMAAALAWLWAIGERALAWRWLAAVVAAATLTTLTKVAFLGYGLGLPQLDFTGVSGHAMFAAAVLPVLLQQLARGPRSRPGVAFAIGAALAGVIAVSRVVVHAHTPSESIAGLLLGLGAARACWPPARPVKRDAGAASVPQPVRRGPPALAWVLLLWALAMPAGAPPSPTHGWVVRLSLALSGRPMPYNRSTAWPVPAARPASAWGARAPRL